MLCWKLSWLCSLDSLPGVVFERGQYDLPRVELAELKSNEARMYYEA